MPTPSGEFKGSGWSRKREAGWQKAFGSKADLSSFKVLMDAYHRNPAKYDYRDDPYSIRAYLERKGWESKP